MEDKETYTNYSKMSDDAVEAKKAGEVQKASPPEKPKEKKTAQPVEPYFVDLIVKKLNIRKGPAKKSTVVEVISSGKLIKIVAEMDGNDGLWGKLESGGWINLAFTKRK